MAKPALISYDGGFLVADCLLDANIADDVQLTQLAVEDGSTVTDHAIRRPRSIQLTLIQTESPMPQDPESAAALQDEGFQRREQTLSVRGRALSTSKYEAEVRQPNVPLGLTGTAGGINAGINALKKAVGGNVLKWEGRDAAANASSSNLRVTVLSPDAPKARADAFHEALLDLLTTSTVVEVAVKSARYPGMVLTSVGRQETADLFGGSRFTVQLQSFNTVTTLETELPAVPQATKPKKRGAKPGKDGASDVAAEERAARSSFLKASTS